MIGLAWKNLWQEKSRLFISLAAVAIVAFLSLSFKGVLNGMIVHSPDYINNLTADIVIAQDGVSNMHMSSSFMPGSMENRVKGLPEVAKAKSIIYYSGLVTLPNGKKTVSYFAGIEAMDTDVGPQEIVKGRNVVSGQEIVMDESIINFYKLSIGDQIEFLDKKLTIVGISRGTGPLINPIIFIPKKKLSSLIRKQGSISYVFVWAQPEQDQPFLISKIKSRLGEDNVNVISRRNFVKNDITMIANMTTNFILIIVVITSLIAAVIISLMLYTLTLNKIRDYGIIKAVGGDNNQIVFMAIWQGLFLGIAGLVVGILLAILSFPALEFISPGVGAFLSIFDIIYAIFIVSLISIIASILPIMKIRNVDPMFVFKT